VNVHDTVTPALAEGPGALLRRSREARGLTEQQAAEQLNLDASAVISMENDDLAALGAPVFARGHLRRYGALLGLSDEELQSVYQQARTQPEQPSLVPHSRLEMEPVRRRPAWPWAVGGIALFLLAAGLVAYVSERGLTLPGRPTATSESVPAGSGGPEVAVAAPTGPAETILATPAPPATIAGEPATDVATGAPPAPAQDTTTPTVPPGHVSVSVSFAADSWAEIYDGSGKAVLYDLGRAGTERTIAAAAPLSVTLGNAAGVKLAVNGRATPLPLPPGQSVARFTVAADGSLR